MASLSVDEPYERPVAYMGVVEDGSVADHHLLADGRGVDDGPVTDRRFAAHLDGGHVAAQHDTGPTFAFGPMVTSPTVSPRG